MKIVPVPGSEHTLRVKVPNLLLRILIWGVGAGSPVVYLVLLVLEEISVGNVIFLIVVIFMYCVLISCVIDEYKDRLRILDGHITMKHGKLSHVSRSIGRPHTYRFALEVLGPDGNVHEEIYDMQERDYFQYDRRGKNYGYNVDVILLIPKDGSEPKKVVHIFFLERNGLSNFNGPPGFLFYTEEKKIKYFEEERARLFRIKPEKEQKKRKEAAKKRILEANTKQREANQKHNHFVNKGKKK